MARLAERALSGPCQAALLGLLLEDMPGQQLALCVAQRFELGADLEFVVVWLGVDYPGPQFEAEPLRQQDHAQDEQLADRQCAVVVEADAPLGQADLARFADLLEQALHHDLAKQVDALVHHLQVVGQRAVAFADVAQQVLRLVIHQVEVAEQAEQGGPRLALQAVFDGPGRAKFQCEGIFDTVVFAAVIRVTSGHGEPTAAVMVRV